MRKLLNLTSFSHFLYHLSLPPNNQIASLCLFIYLESFTLLFRAIAKVRRYEYLHRQNMSIAALTSNPSLKIAGTFCLIICCTRYLEVFENLHLFLHQYPIISLKNHPIGFYPNYFPTVTMLTDGEIIWPNSEHCSRHVTLTYKSLVHVQQFY